MQIIPIGVACMGLDHIGEAAPNGGTARVLVDLLCHSACC